MKFYEQTPEARRHQLVQEGSLTSTDAALLAAARTLPDATATRLIENAIDLVKSLIKFTQSCDPFRLK